MTKRDQNDPKVIAINAIDAIGAIYQLANPAMESYAKKGWDHPDTVTYTKRLLESLHKNRTRLQALIIERAYEVGLQETSILRQRVDITSGGET